MVPMAGFWLIQYTNGYQILYTPIGLFILAYSIACVGLWSVQAMNLQLIKRPGDPLATAKIFISYRRHDSEEITGRIYDRLVQRFGKEQVFKDVDSIPLGVDFREHLNKMVGSCDVLLAVMGNEWLTAKHPDGGRRIGHTKDFVRIELEAAIDRKTPVIPVLVRGAQVPPETELPPSLAPLAYRNGIPVRSDPDFHRDVDRLIAGVENHLEERSQQRVP
jgi:hypothetical protein